jgi:lipopolysaccharide/colanic/teichoic acid biosynthesis glycosyltransferase/glycosyltransferase involved in cell wall biosynthesis
MSLTVSVVIPAYQSADSLPACLTALQQQTFPPQEILVVDDASTDQTATVAAGYGIRVVQHPQRRGPAAARNSGAQAAQGEIIAFTDADCAPDPDWLAELIRPFNDPEVVGAKGTYHTRQTERVARFVQQEYESKYQRMARRTTIDFIDTYSAAYRRTIFLENGGFDVVFTVPSVEDQELSFRLAIKGYKLIFVPSARVSHCHDRSFSEYLRRKFGIGYWKAQLLRWHPHKALGDAHTPLSQRWQVFLIGPVLASLIFAFLWPPARWLAAGLLGSFLLTTVPFLGWIARQDRPVLGVALPMIFARATAQAVGLALGLLSTARHSTSHSVSLPGFAQLLKRGMDLGIAVIGLILSAPVMFALAILIKLETPGPVIFRQVRVGQHGRLFTIFKFRSMVVDAEARLAEVLPYNPLPGPAFKIPNDPRVTRVGRFMRRWSLDELPQFWNVLQGEMSLVGPRPEEPRVVADYTDWHRRRLAVKPGLTGPMQVNGRGWLSLDERVKFELDYIENYSLKRDVLILLRSIPVVLSGHGAY